MRKLVGRYVLPSIVLWVAVVASTNAYADPANAAVLSVMLMDKGPTVGADETKPQTSPADPSAEKGLDAPARICLQPKGAITTIAMAYC